MNKRRRLVIMVIVAAAALFLASSCTTSVNRQPIITSLEAEAERTTPSGSLQVMCSASDPDGDELSYEWSTSGGSITGTGAAVNWIAPEEVGVYQVTVVVKDGQSEEDTKSVILSVATGTPPVNEGPDPATQIWGEIIPEGETVTSYGIPLSLENTQQFINWYNSIALSAEEQATRDVALTSLVAPCCEEYPMSTCCCECNLARSVWGLSAYLIADKGYGVNLVQEAASQWLHFIRPDYYVGRALVEEGIDPNQWGFTIESSCFAGHCDRPFYTKTSSSHLGGCGGMNELIQVELT